MIGVDKDFFDYINSFSSEAQKNGKRFHREGKVVQIFGDDRFIQGQVALEDNLIRVRLNSKNGNWFGESSRVLGESDPCLVALMYERMRRRDNLPLNPNEHNGVVFSRIIEERLGRKLRMSEMTFLDKIERRYRRFCTEDAIFDYDVVRIHPKWEVATYDPLQLWPVAPIDIVEFWNYLAYAFYKRNLVFPKFLNVITDLEAIEDKLKNWESEREVTIWKKKCIRFINQIDDRDTIKVDFRLMISNSDFRLQWHKKIVNDDRNNEHAQDETREQKSDDTKLISDNNLNNAEGLNIFKNINDITELEEIFDLHENGKIILDEKSELLWSQLHEILKTENNTSLKLSSLFNCKILNRLFQQPSIYPLLVTLDEKPFEKSKLKLFWKCQKILPHPDKDKDEEYCLHLYSSDDEKIPHTVRWLPGTNNLYIIDDCILEGPTCWEKDTEVMPFYNLPKRVVESENGIGFLTKINCILPKELKKRIQDTTIKVKVRCEIKSQLQGYESEQLLAFVEAKDEKGRFFEKFIDDEWVKQVDDIEKNNKTIFRVNKKSQFLFPKVLLNLGLSFDQKHGVYKTRVTKNLPERLIEWVNNLPSEIDLQMDERLESIFKEPVKAKFKIEVVNENIDWFDIRLNLDIEGYSLSQTEIRKLITARGGFVRTKDGKWLRMGLALNKEQKASIEKLGIDPFDFNQQTHRMHVLQLYVSTAENVFEDKIWKKISDRAAKLKLSVQPEIDKKLKAELRPYQLEGYHFLAYLTTNNFGGILADDMGLGKTVQSIAWLLWLNSQKKINKTNAYFSCMS